MGTQYKKKYNDLMECLMQMHENNLKRTKFALRSLIIVPTIFLIMLLFTSSSKTIFLVLWIASMFGIAVILIVVEYQDYMLRRIISDAEIDGSAADEALDEAFEYDNYREAPSEDDQQ